MIVQFSGPDESPQQVAPIPQILPGASSVTNALILGALGVFLFNSLKHKTKERRVHRLRSKVKAYQSKLRSAEGRLTKRGSKKFF